MIKYHNEHFIIRLMQIGYGVKAWQRSKGRFVELEFFRTMPNLTRFTDCYEFDVSLSGTVYFILTMEEFFTEFPPHPL